MAEPLRVADASVFVRYLVGDNTEMQARARRLIDGAYTFDEKLSRAGLILTVP